MESEGSGENCRPTTLPLEDQCAHVKEECPGSDSLLSIDYVERYFCARPEVRPWTFAGLTVWLIFLFSTIGISASDFFCPNLATVAHTLGLDENVAGVTFLAFGNGSPDVFSTFSALRSHTGTLAVGELFGAASFIVSCVVGSMCIISPFKVDKFPFLRDVCFFFAAVSLVIAVLWDGKLMLWEALLLVGLYFIYVCVVVVGSWWERRQEARRAHEALIRDEYSTERMPEIEYHDEPPYRDEPNEDEASIIPTSEEFDSSQALMPTATPMDRRPHFRPRAKSQPGPPPIQTDVPRRYSTVRRNRRGSGSTTPTINDPTYRRTRTTSHQMPSFSLIGALEFRQVVASLASQAAGDPLNLHIYQESPLTPYVRGHYPHHHSHSSASRPRTPDQEQDPWDVAAGSVQLHERSPHISPSASVGRLDQMIFPSNLPSETDASSHRFTPPSKRQRVKHVLYRVWHTLFPTLHHFWGKTLMEKVVSLFAAPAVMTLTVTLPVVVTPLEPEESIEKLPETAEGSADSRLIDFEEEGVEVERALIAEEETAKELRELKYNKWLMAAQCIFGPLWCAAVLFDDTKHEAWLLLATGITGTAAAILVLIFSKSGENPTMRTLRCSMGFLVATVWIMAIADEVVGVLRAFGFIFGLSDAIIGLTIFAVGNSIADLVANMSVAVFAPIMGFSACFGGPMLNILLGVGISGSYVIYKSSKPYDLPLSRTLVVNGLGLLAILIVTVIVVPLNGYFLTRSWGIFLIACYAVLVAVTVVVELKGDKLAF